jgi:hypothetical protein
MFTATVNWNGQDLTLLVARVGAEPTSPPDPIRETFPAMFPPPIVTGVASPEKGELTTDETTTGIYDPQRAS